MVTKITQIELDDGFVFLDGRKVVDYDDNEVFLLPCDGIAMSCPDYLSDELLLNLKILFETHNTERIYLIFKNRNKLISDTFKSLEPSYLVSVGFVNYYGNFFASDHIATSGLNFRNYAVLPVEFRQYIHSCMFEDVIEPTCQCFHYEEYEQLLKTHMLALREIVEELPCRLAFLDNKIVGYLGWKRRVSLPGLMSLQTTHWIDKSLSKDVRSSLHTDFFGYMKSILDKDNFICAFSNIKNEKSKQLFLKNNYVPFVVIVRMIKGEKS